MYFADLHIHSKYSRATSRDCDAEHLDLWARRKGLGLIGTGDFTHPTWRNELREALIPAEDGLYMLRESLRLDDDTTNVTALPRFLVSGEISSIYKKNGKVRKVHNLILLPGLEEAEALAQKLEAIGNIHSDGRPILGLDSRDLLEITLESCPEAVFIPAHIWTPHFSLFGAFSGFDTIEECFEDLTPHIHALETGLSSDPPMNWRISALDRYHLVSNSDAHSPQKLGREANRIEAALSYPALRKALHGGREKGLAGTVEFFPEEGKYHYDGHRACGICLAPAETIGLGGKCPVCGRKITIGVDHRVEALADRTEGRRPANAGNYESLVPLPEVLAGSTGYSAASVKVDAAYRFLLKELGPEYYILREAPITEIEQAAGPCVAEGIRRLRAGQVERSPGYDGEYGTIRLLRQDEIERISGQQSLFGELIPVKKTRKPAVKPRLKPEAEAETAVIEAVSLGTLAELNPEQTGAATAAARSIAVVAGPGTGKTKTLVGRVLHLIQSGVKPSEITAVTFTNRAAGEMRERLEQELGKKGTRALTVGTFHAICLQEPQEQRGNVCLIDEYNALELAAEVLRESGAKQTPRQFLREVSRIKNGVPPEQADCNPDTYAYYNERLVQAGVLDFDDLLCEAAALWECAPNRHSIRFNHLLLDEFQDMNALQYRLIRAWGQHGASLFAIGDPDQSIYGFHGSSADCFELLFQEYPETQVFRLTRNYRSAPEILGCALPVISRNPGGERVLLPQRKTSVPVHVVTAESELSEGIYVAKEIGRMAGGLDMLDAQFFGARNAERTVREFSDIALLYRTHRQADLLGRCLQKEGIPYVVTGRDDFLADKTVRGATAFFRFLEQPGDLASLRSCLKLIWNCPADLADGFSGAWAKAYTASFSPELLAAVPDYRGISHLLPFRQMVEEFFPHVAKEPPRKLLENWYEKTSGGAMSAPFKQFLNTAVFHKKMTDFLQTLLLGREADIRRSEKVYTSGAVTLSTLHGAKGLEFPVVFLCGASKGRIPLERPGRPVDFEEERRLFYVGMTRAKDELYLLASGEPSPFLADLPKQFCMEEKARARNAAVAGKQLSLF